MQNPSTASSQVNTKKTDRTRVIQISSEPDTRSVTMIKASDAPVDQANRFGR